MLRHTKDPEKINTWLRRSIKVWIHQWRENNSLQCCLKPRRQRTSANRQVPTQAKLSQTCNQDTEASSFVFVIPR